MSSAFSRTASVLAKRTGKGPRARLRSSYRHLKDLGVEALLPSIHAKYPDGKGKDVLSLPVSERSWHPPRVSNRKARVLRKAAIQNGSYGSFDGATGTGWDSSWDVQLAVANPQGLGRYNELRVRKLAKRHRTREQRALNIEEKMEGMDERMEDLQATRIKNKPEKTFEYRYNNAMQRSGRSS